MCKWWEPGLSPQHPKTRRTWIPLYPVSFGVPSTWNCDKKVWSWLFECSQCGAEKIIALCSGAPICKCQQKKPKAKSLVMVKCFWCGKHFWKTYYNAKRTDKHSCSRECSAVARIESIPTKEWRNLGARPRGYNLGKIKVGTYDGRI